MILFDGRSASVTVLPSLRPMLVAFIETEPTTLSSFYYNIVQSKYDNTTSRHCQHVESYQAGSVEDPGLSADG